MQGKTVASRLRLGSARLGMKRYERNFFSCLSAAQMLTSRGASLPQKKHAGSRTRRESRKLGTLARFVLALCRCTESHSNIYKSAAACVLQWDHLCSRSSPPHPPSHLLSSPLLCRNPLPPFRPCPSSTLAHSLSPSPSTAAFLPSRSR